MAAREYRLYFAYCVTIFDTITDDADKSKVNWCRENTQESWNRAIIYEAANAGWRYYFKNENDAVMFKLRFG